MEALGLDVLFMGSNATRLLQGLWVAVQISAISVVLSIILGMLFGIFMTWKNPVAKVISRLYLEIVRIMPQLVLLYIVFFGATRVMGLNISAELSSIIVFVFWGTGEMGDLVRGALTSIPKQQYESAAALGLNKAQIYRQVIIPQAIRAVLPALGNEFIMLLKDTSLITVIGGKELLYAAQGIMNRTYEAMYPLLGVALIYLVLVMLFTRLLAMFERRLAQSDR